MNTTSNQPLSESLPPDSIVTLTLNPALDLTVQLESCELGKVNLALEGQMNAAGKGVNVARVLRDLGAAVTVTGVLGADNRAPFDELFRSHDLVSRFVYSPGQTRTNVKLCEASQRVTDINLPGLVVGPESLETLLATVDDLAKPGRLFVVSGSLPSGLDATVYGQIVARLKQENCRVIVDTSGEALGSAIAATPTLIKPNIDELAQWAGSASLNRAEQEDLVRQLLHRGIEQVVVSDGARGLRWYSREGSYEALPPRVTVLSTVGAGDSLVAGITYGLAQRWTIPEILSQATAVSALAVTQVGVGIPSRDALHALQQQVTVQPLPFSL